MRRKMKRSGWPADYIFPKLHSAKVGNLQVEENDLDHDVNKNLVSASVLKLSYQVVV